MNNTKHFEELHSQYIRLSGISLPFSMPCLYRWEMWESRGWTDKDLELVISYIKRRIKSGQRKIESLKLSMLLDQDRFAEDLSMASAESRTPKVDYGKQQALRSVGRSNTVQKDTSKQPAQIMQEHAKMAELLAAWKKDGGI